jgi:D-amino-acid oxidase
MHVVVIGGGVVGLSSAIRLLESGHTVELWARELPPHTTSDVAAAVWYPYRAWPPEKTLGWGQRTYEVLEHLAGQPGTGVFLSQGREFLRRRAQEDPWWSPCVRGFRRLRPEELAPGYAGGYAFEAPVAEMPRYLPYLLGRLRGLGGTVQQRAVRSLEEAWARAECVVNCTGLGARELVGDTSLHPIRGEVLRVARPPEERFLLDEDETHGVAYVIPRSEDCILGGTAEEGRESLEPDPQQARGILERAARLLPPGTQVQVLEHRVGLRPGRPSVRLELEQAGSRRLIHNYGHGGAGVTLSWGCAEEVVSLAAG